MTNPAVTALRRSHDNLQALVGSIPPDRLTDPSYASEWTIAQVLSHLGSGAVIGKLALDGALSEGERPGVDQVQPIWDEWNAKTPRSQAVDALEADEVYIAAYEALDDDRLAALHFTMGPMELDGPAMVRGRLAEHALHTWDIAVMRDPAATVDPVAIDLIVDGMGLVARFSGKPQGGPEQIVVATSEPERRFVLDVTESVELRPAQNGAGPVAVGLPAEAFVRLVYGRLDPAHTPAGAESAALDKLRAMFPGI